MCRILGNQHLPVSCTMSKGGKRWKENLFPFHHFLGSVEGRKMSGFEVFLSLQTQYFHMWKENTNSTNLFTALPIVSFFPSITHK